MENNLLSVGIDIGASGVKGVLMDSGGVLSAHKHETLAPGSQAAEAVLKLLLEKSGRKREDVSVAVTGISTDRIQFADLKKTALSCITRGARYHFNTAQTVVDIGAETTTAISLNTEGKVLEYVRNNKCAAGTAMLLKVMSEILQIPISEMDHEKYHSDKKQKLSNVCSVFAESEAISYLSHGTPREEILAGAFAAIEDQLVSLLSRIDIHEDVILTGGTARNRVITNHLAERIGYPIHLPESPEMIAAIGAALLGRDAHQRG
jgi:(R)-2-hydroxyacyl-CoA dehydratese activating ATPase